MSIRAGGPGGIRKGREMGKKRPCLCPEGFAHSWREQSFSLTFRRTPFQPREGPLSKILSGLELKTSLGHL